MLPLNTGDCLIEVTTCADSTVFAAALFFCLLSVERVKVYHRSVCVVAIGYIVNHRPGDIVNHRPGELLSWVSIRRPSVR
jgi:hypothetical protein